MPTPPEEAILVARAQCGDRAALEAVVAAIQPPLLRYVTRLIGRDAAADIVQDALIAVVQKLAWLSRPELFRAWAFRIASRLAWRHLRRERRWRHEEPSADALDQLVAPERGFDDELLRDLLERSDVLSEANRAVFVLHFQEGLTLSEVAAVLEIPLGTVKSRLAYGLGSLRKHLAHTQGDSRG